MDIIIIGIVLYLMTRKKTEVKKPGGVVIDPKTGKVVFVKGSKPPVGIDKYKSSISWLTIIKRYWKMEG